MSDDEDELTAVAPVDTAKPAEPILIAEFEGDYVRDFEGKLPALSMIMPEGYARGTHLKLMVEVRIRNVRYEEKRAKTDARPELIRQHMFALEEIQLVGAYTPEEMDPGVGGTAAAAHTLLEDLGPGLEDRTMESLEQSSNNGALPVEQLFDDSRPSVADLDF